MARGRHRQHAKRVCYPIRIAADTPKGSASGQPPLQKMADSGSLSLHAIEGFLENFEIAGIANLFARILNPLLLQ